METWGEVTCANTSAIFKNAWWQYQNYLKKTYFTGKETHQIPLRSPETHLLVPNQECGKVYELIFHFEVLYACNLVYSIRVEQVLKPEEQLVSFKIPLPSCILLCSCITVFTQTNLF